MIKAFHGGFEQFNIPGSKRYRSDLPVDPLITSNRDPFGLYPAENDTYILSTRDGYGVSLDTDGAPFVDQTPGVPGYIKFDHDGVPYIAEAVEAPNQVANE